MPEIVRDNTLRAGIVLAGLILFPVYCVQTFADEDADKAGSAGTAPQAELPDGAANVGGELPADPREAYQVIQRRSVQALRRLNKSLLTPQVIIDYQNGFRKYRGLIRGGTSDRRPAEMKILKAGLKYRIYQMTDRAVQDDPAAIENALTSIRREIGQAGSAINNNQQKAQFRELVFREMTPLLKELLRNNLLARSCAIEILNDLEVVPPGLQGRMVMYDEVDNILIEILDDPKQPNAVKVRAANSIANYLQKHDAIPQIQMSMASAIERQLKLPYTSVAHQDVMLNALEEISVPRQLVAPNRHIAFSIAAELMQNRSRDIRIRCHAAAIFGRAGFDNRTNFTPLAWAIADLTGETAFMFQQGNKELLKWKDCGYHLYRAFHHWVPAGAQSGPPGYPKGMLNRDSRNTTIREAWDVSIPLMVALCSQKGAAGKDMLKLIEWTKKNKPADLKFDPTCAPLAVPANAPPPANGGGNTDGG